MTGLTIGIIGLVLTVLLCGIGSGLGLKATGKASAGVLAEDPSKFSKVIVLSLLPATQGIYGFLIAILGASYLPTVANLQAAGILEQVTGANAAIGAAQINAQGWNVFWACLPMMIGGAVSAFLQGRTAASTIIAVGKKGEIASKSIIFPAMIEFYALLGLVVSIMMFNNMPIADVANITVKPAVEEATKAVLTLIGA
ncbi:MAG: V-type ATP synthase subunit K [Clostridiales bacterium]|nr:V-type ATP synthase subunit K [Clostridiales bacterium]